jgi:hypothetical protein
MTAKKPTPPPTNYTPSPTSPPSPIKTGYPQLPNQDVEIGVTTSGRVAIDLPFNKARLTVEQAKRVASMLERSIALAQEIADDLRRRDNQERA